MKRYKIASVEALDYPILRVRFDDGFEELYDLGSEIDAGPLFARLKDKQIFKSVAVSPRGTSFGWYLDQPGSEIDLSADGIRTMLETQRVLRLAATHSARQTAAE